MKSVVVYFSKFGNTRQIAEAIADTLRSRGPVQVLHTDGLAAAGFHEADLVVMGTPTHRMKLPERVRAMLEALPERTLEGTPVAAFDTSYRASAVLAHFTAAPKLLRRLQKLGGSRLVPPETFHVVTREGPLYDGEMDRARAWTEAIVLEHRRLHEQQKTGRPRWR